jgi:hypothetical protein
VTFKKEERTGPRREAVPVTLNESETFTEGEINELAYTGPKLLWLPTIRVDARIVLDVSWVDTDTVDENTLALVRMGVETESADKAATEEEPGPTTREMAETPETTDHPVTTKDDT